MSLQLDDFGHDKNVAINKDFRPMAYQYNLVYWINHFYPRFAKTINGLRPKLFLIAIVIFIFAFFLFSMKKRGASSQRKHLSFYAMIFAGFSLMAAELMMIYMFQVFYGNLYYKISWIITLFMAGIGYGAWVANQKMDEANFWNLSKIHFRIAVYFMLWISFGWLFQNTQIQTMKGGEFFFYLLAFLGGELVGFEFPYANRIYLSEPEGNASHLGTIYAADLIGSCAGAILVSVLMIPILGLFPTFGLLAVLNLLFGGELFFRKHLSCKNI